ncbi:MAG TPA: ACP S-malonyltransferase [Acidimicrobiia bacterium]|nr:ACP S-malonyltransferase [Acidimicrobiia bacterium]
MSVGILFPGQGSQHVGMGREIFEARPDLLGERADRTLGFSLRSMCLDGPEEELTRTEHAQPALFALCFALWDVFVTETGVTPAGAAGHSLGEYTALTAAGFFDYYSALATVARRGRAMAAAAEASPSGMAALLGVDEAEANQICARRTAMGGRLEVANINAPGQVVVAGGSADIEWLVENARELGVRRAIPLQVSGAFHSTFMEPAAAVVAAALEEVEIAEPRFPVWANTTATPHTPKELKMLLTRQVESPVRFSDSLSAMAATGIDTFIHIGPGDVTAGLAKRTVEGARVLVVSGIDDIGAAAEAIGTMGRL